MYSLYFGTETTRTATYIYFLYKNYEENKLY